MRKIFGVFIIAALTCSACANDVNRLGTTGEAAQSTMYENSESEAITDDTETQAVCDVETLKKWHEVQEEEAYELIRKVLLGEQVFYYYGDISGNNSGYMDMPKLLDTVFENRADTSKWKLVFVDLDGDDAIKECVLRCEDSERHYNIVFHYFAGVVYASELTYRDGTFIYASGIIEGSGSGFNAYWYRLGYNWGTEATHRQVAGWNYCRSITTSLDLSDYVTVPMGSRTEAWITVDGVLTEVPGDVCNEWMRENNFPGELAEEYDFTEENINRYIVYKNTQEEN